MYCDLHSAANVNRKAFKPSVKPGWYYVGRKMVRTVSHQQQSNSHQHTFMSDEPVKMPTSTVFVCLVPLNPGHCRL